MRKLSIVVVVVLALAAAGLAVGKTITAKSVATVAGTFGATTASNVQTSTCTTSDGTTLAVSRGTYTGTAVGAADVAGPITLNVHSVINTTADAGVVTGRLKIDTASSRDTVADFNAVYDHGKLAGLASGHTGTEHVGLLANLSAGFTTAGGFQSGALGASAGGSAVELGPAKCVKPTKEQSSARGTVAQATSTSITVAGLTCTVPTALAAKVTALTKTDVVEIHCQLVNGVNTLVTVNKRK